MPVLLNFKSCHRSLFLASAERRLTRPGKKNKIRQAVQLHTVYFRLEPQCNMTPAWSENSRIQFSQGVFCPDRSTSPIWNKVKPGFLLRCLLENTEMPASFMPHNMPTYSLFLFFLFLCFFNLHSIKSYVFRSCINTPPNDQQHIRCYLCHRLTANMLNREKLRNTSFACRDTWQDSLSMD